jgi:hypothetical protein
VVVTCKSVEVQTIGEVQEKQTMVMNISPDAAPRVDVIVTPAAVLEVPQDKQVMSVAESPSIEILNECFTKLDSCCG